MSAGSISSVSYFNLCILILCLPTTYLYVKVLLSGLNFLVTSAQRRSKISYDVIFVHLKNEKKLIFFQRKCPFFQISKIPRQFFFYPFVASQQYFFLLRFNRIGQSAYEDTSTLGVDHFKVYDLGIFDKLIRVRNKFLPFKLLKICLQAIKLVPR